MNHGPLGRSGLFLAVLPVTYGVQFMHITCKCQNVTTVVDIYNQRKNATCRKMQVVHLMAFAHKPNSRNEQEWMIQGEQFVQ